MTLSQQLEQLGRYEDYEKANWVDEPDRELPNDTDGQPVEVGAKYWHAFSNYIYNNEDSISMFLESEGYEPRECSYHTLQDDYDATLVTFDADGYERGARRDR